MAERFTQLEQDDRKRYPFFPSAKGRSHWMIYIEHRLKMMTNGMSVYSSRKYRRLRLDKYIEENRASDLIAAWLTLKKACLIFIGAAEMAPNSPIGIKKRLRCPGVRRLVRSFNKLGKSVIRFVDEFNTSQTCGKCFQPFDRRTRLDRYKVCHNCKPSGEVTNIWLLGKTVISKKSNREYMKQRQSVVADVEGRNQNPIMSYGLVSKLTISFKKWRLNDDNEWIDDRHPHQLKTVWHRDIVAAVCILYKGIVLKIEYSEKLKHIIFINYSVACDFGYRSLYSAGRRHASAAIERTPPATSTRSWKC